jgi:hypothetical protein
MAPSPFPIYRTVLLCALLSGGSLSAAASEKLPQFGLPIDCELGLSCFVQNYVDHDSSDGVRDFKCNMRSYNGHNGTDFRVPSMAAQKRGVAVLSIADGVIKSVRDGMDDVSIRIAGEDVIRGKECGNGVVVEHTDGWTSQYCHLAKRSVGVRSGDRVARGQPIGLVGLSGATEFPHVHLAIRHNGEPVDPFAYRAAPESCVGGHSLWSPLLTGVPSYKETEILNFGFASNALTMDAIETGAPGLHPISRHTPIVAYVRIIGLKVGDGQELSIRSPDGDVIALHQGAPLESSKAQAFISVGRKPPASAWPTGRYAAIYVLTRRGKEILRKSFEKDLRPSEGR